MRRKVEGCLVADFNLVHARCTPGSNAQNGVSHGVILDGIYLAAPTGVVCVPDLNLGATRFSTCARSAGTCFVAPHRTKTKRTRVYYCQMDAQTKALITASIRGVAQVTESSMGLTFSRLPAWTELHHQHDALTGKVAKQGSGVRLLLATSATQISLIYRATLDAPESVDNPGASTISISCEGFEESISHSNGDVRVWTGPDNPELVRGENSVATFNLPETLEATSPDVRQVSIWLPHNCEVELIGLEANAPLEPGAPSKKRWLHYGSSISHSMEADNPLGVWPTRVAIDEGLDLYSLGLAGSCNLEHFAARTIAAWPAGLITLKLGINVVNGATMTERTFISAVHGLLDIIREQQPETRVVLISPIYCEGHETNPGPTSAAPDGKATGSKPSGIDWVKELTLVRAREILADVVSRRAEANLEYIDGLQLFSAADSHLMPDGLHPNAEGYLLIAERFKKLVF